MGHQLSCWWQNFIPPLVLRTRPHGGDNEWNWTCSPENQCDASFTVFLNAEKIWHDGICKPYAKEISPLSAWWEKWEWSHFVGCVISSVLHVFSFNVLFDVFDVFLYMRICDAYIGYVLFISPYAVYVYTCICMYTYIWFPCYAVCLRDKVGL